MRDVAAELKELRLHGMAGAWADLVAQGTLGSLDSSRWLIEMTGHRDSGRSKGSAESRSFSSQTMRDLSRCP